MKEISNENKGILKRKVKKPEVVDNKMMNFIEGG